VERLPTLLARDVALECGTVGQAGVKNLWLEMLQLTMQRVDRKRNRDRVGLELLLDPIQLRLALLAELLSERSFNI
jgi:hypothetical protein